MAVGEIFQLTISHSNEGSSEGQNVFTWRHENGTGDDEVFNDLIDWVTTKWHPVWEDIAIATASIIEGSVVCLNNDGTVKRVLGTTVLALTGNKIGDGLAAATSPMIFAATERPKTRGRKFCVGPADTDLTNGLWDNDMLNGLAQLILVYTAGFVGPEASVFTPGVLSTVDQLFYQLKEEGSFNDIPDYQRRRRPDRGS